MSTPAPRVHQHPGRWSVVLGGVLAWLLLPVSAASAHPFVSGGGELPVDSLAEITLQIAHGCGDEGDAEGADTREVALEIPDWLRVVEVEDHDGYDATLEASDGRTAVVTWRDAGGAEPAPALDLAVVADGEVGDTRYLRVFQACDDASYRWIGTPDDPADDPAIEVELAAADPDRPAPPEEELEEPEEEPSDEQASAGDDGPTDEPAAGEADEAGGDAPDDPADPADPEAAAAADGDDDRGLSTWLIPALIAVAVIGLGVGVARRRRRGGSPSVDADPTPRP